MFHREPNISNGTVAAFWSVEEMRELRARGRGCGGGGRNGGRKERKIVEYHSENLKSFFGAGKADAREK